MSASYLKVLLLILISNIFLVQPKTSASIIPPDTSSGYEVLQSNFIKIGQDFLKTHIKIDHCQIRIRKDKEDIILTDISKSVPARLQIPGRPELSTAIYFWDKDLYLLYENQDQLNKDWEIIKIIHLNCENRSSHANQNRLYNIFDESNRSQGEWPLRTIAEGSGVALIPKGKDSLIHRHQLISDAQQSIWYKTFEFYGDESGISIAEALINKKKKKNLDIRVFVDAFPLWMESDHRTVINTERLYSNLMAAGIPVFGSTCDGRKAIYKEMSEDIHGIKHLNYRYHEKSLITDAGTSYESKKAIVGGLNSTNQYFRIGLEKWSDVDILTKGLAVDDIGSAFLEDWDTYGRKNKANFSCLNPYTPKSQEYKKFFNKFTRSYIEPNTKQNKINQLISEAEISHLKNENQQVRRYHDATVKFIKNDPRTGNKGKKNSIENSLIKIFDDAKNEIIISNIYFIPSKAMIKSLRRAVMRGVNITILTNSKKSNSQHANVRLSRFYYETIADPYVNQLNIKRLFKTIFSKKYRDHKKEWSRLSDSEKGSVIFYEFHGEPDTTVEVSSVRAEDSSADPLSLDSHPFKKTIHNLIRGDRSGLTLLHSKYFVIDRKFTCIGSYNIDPRSRNLSREHVLWVESKKLAYDLLEKFAEDISVSEKISSDQIHKFRHPEASLKQLNLWLTRSFKSML